MATFCSRINEAAELAAAYVYSGKGFREACVDVANSYDLPVKPVMSATSKLLWARRRNKNHQAQPRIPGLEEEESK